MGADAVKILDLINGFMASAFFVYFVITLSRKPRFEDNMKNMIYGMLLYQTGAVFTIFAEPFFDKDVIFFLFPTVSLIPMFIAVCVLSRDSLWHNIMILIMYAVPKLLVELFMIGTARMLVDDIDDALNNEYIVSLFTIFSITVDVVYCICVIMFVNRKLIRSILLPILLMCCFPILGLIDILFVLAMAPEKVGLENSIGGSLQLYITVTIAILMSRFIRRNNALIMQEREQVELERLKDIDTQYYDEVQRDVNFARKFRHDITNYAEQIEYLLDHPDEKSKETLHDMIQGLKERANNIAAQHYCEDSLINMVLFLKHDRCRKNSINMTIKANLPEVPDINPLDKSSIVSNLLDNAINESIRCKEAGMDSDVNVSIGQMGDYIAVRVENYTLLDGSFNDIDSLMKRKKETYDRSSHGYGLIILKEKIAQYDGSIVLDIKDHKCVIIVTIKNGETGEIANVQSSDF